MTLYLSYCLCIYVYISIYLPVRSFLYSSSNSCWYINLLASSCLSIYLPVRSFLYSSSNSCWDINLLASSCLSIYLPVRSLLYSSSNSCWDINLLASSCLSIYLPVWSLLYSSSNSCWDINLLASSWCTWVQSFLRAATNKHTLNLNINIDRYCTILKNNIFPAKICFRIEMLKIPATKRITHETYE